MTVEQMRRKRQQFGYSCEQLSELSGVSLETVQKIFHDNEEVFSQDILKQIESVFENKRWNMEYKKKVESVLLRITINFRMKDEQS